MFLHCEKYFIAGQPATAQYVACARRRFALVFLVTCGVGGTVGALVWKKHRLAGAAAGAAAVPVGVGLLALLYANN